MRTLFISYDRESRTVTESLASDAERLGYTVWYDAELSGGQTWWDKIIASIRECEIFLYVLTPASLHSIACQREYEYAVALRKPILPVLAADGVSQDLMPSSLASIQYVDYRVGDRLAAISLSRALLFLPHSDPLPDPIPLPPEIPLSSLNRVADRLAHPGRLSFEEQGALLLDLKRAARDPKAANDAEKWVTALRKRDDLVWAVAEEIDEWRLSTKERHHEPASHSQVSAHSTGQSKLDHILSATNAPQFRAATYRAMLGALGGAVFGVLIVAAAFLTIIQSGDVLDGLGLSAGAWAITGGVSRCRARLIKVALLSGAAGAAIGVLALSQLADQPDDTRVWVAIGLIVGSSIGSVLVTSIVAVRSWALRDQNAAGSDRSDHQ